MIKKQVNKKPKWKLQHPRGAVRAALVEKRLFIAKLHSNKTTPNGLGRITCSVLRISSG
jgi:hypothetical protein